MNLLGAAECDSNDFLHLCRQPFDLIELLERFSCVELSLAAATEGEYLFEDCVSRYSLRRVDPLPVLAHLVEGCYPGCKSVVRICDLAKDIEG